MNLSQARRSIWIVAAVLLAGCNPTLPPAAAFLPHDADASFSDGGETDAGPDDGGVVGADGGTDGGIVVEEKDGGLLPPDGGHATHDAGVPQAIGGGCASDADCVGGGCYADAPGGYCTQSCANGAPCPTGSACSVQLGNYCVQTCTMTADCRDGYSCQGGACLAAYCQADFQCTGGKVCDPNLRVCVTHLSCDTNVDCPAGQSCQNGACDGTTASGCTSNSDCPAGESCGRNGVCSGGTSMGPSAGQIGATCTGFGGGRCTQGPQPQCLGQNQNFSGGYCTSSCQATSDCGQNNVCAKLSDERGNFVPLCLQSCTSNAGCRPQYNCVAFQGQSFCLNQCKSNADCPLPLSQTCNVTTGLCSP